MHRHLRRILMYPLAAALGLSLPASVDAQLFASRTTVAVPLDAEARPPGLLAGFSYMADMQRGWLSAGDDRAWDARLSGAIELYRFSSTATLTITAADELVANGGGGFNPRGIAWDLGVGFTQKLSIGTAEFGFMHYCRHSVDALDPPEPPFFRPGFVATERFLATSALRGRIISPTVVRSPELALRGGMTAEVFTNGWDGAKVEGQPTANPAVDSWKQAFGSVSGDGRADFVVGGMSAYARGSVMAIMFRGSKALPVSSSLRGNSRAELGWTTPGREGRLDVYVAFEHVYDDYNTIGRRPSNVLGIGLRLSDRYQF